MKEMKEQNGLLALLMLYLSHKKYLNMALEHSLALELNASENNKILFQRGLYPPPHMLPEIRMSLIHRGDELKKLVKSALTWSVFISIISLGIAYIAGAISTDLPIDRKKTFFAIGYAVLVIATMTSLLKGPESFDGNTLAEIAYLKLKTHLYALALILGFIGVLL